MTRSTCAGGRAIRARRQRDDELEHRNAALLRNQVVRERQAAAEERRRIARELHDIVAHRVTTIVIQAESGAATADDAGRAAEAFATIAESGRQSLDELRRLLGLLREDDQSSATGPSRASPGSTSCWPTSAGRDSRSTRWSRGTSRDCPRVSA